MASVTARIGAFVETQWFQYAILGVIVLASVLVGFETNLELAEQYATFFDIANTVILVIFIAEIVLRITACGKRWWIFFDDPWNIFDFVIVAVTALPLHTHFFAVFRLVRLVRLLRVVRLVRVVKTVRILRLLRHLRALQIVVDSLVRSVPSIISIALLLFIHFYIYGVVGTFLFHAHDAEHFGSLSHSLFTLFQTLTLEGWVDVMEIQLGLQDLPFFVVVLYFVTFIILGTMIILNLVIGVVVNTMSDVKEEQEELAHLSNRKRALTIRDEIHLVEQQLKEASICMRILKKNLEAEERKS